MTQQKEERTVHAPLLFATGVMFLSVPPLAVRSIDNDVQCVNTYRRAPYISTTSNFKGRHGRE